jgi:hypothetical protein
MINGLSLATILISYHFIVFFHTEYGHISLLYNSKYFTIMKRISIKGLLMAFMLAGTMVSCGLVEDLLDVSFTTGYDEVSFTVNPSDAGEYLFTEEYLQSDLEQEIADEGGDINNLKEVTINEAILEVVTAGKNLDPFDWVEVYISTPSIDEVMVASAEVIANGQVSVELQIAGDDLKNILEEEEYTVRVVGELGESIDEAIDLLIKIKYDVVVGA